MGTVRLAKHVVIADKWRLERELGRGAMGEVWLATHSTLGESAAIKILDRRAFPPRVADEARSRFHLEARVAAKLARKTRHVVRVVDNGVDGDLDYLVMELLEGKTVEERLLDGALDVTDVAQIVRQAARGLSATHAAGVVHRDVKPGNIFLTKDDEGDLVVKLLDYGVAKLSAREEREPALHATSAGVAIGTPHYMSPEQARGVSVDARVDVWALAAVAYELLTARPAFDSENAMEVLMQICTAAPPSPRAFRPSLPPAVDALFARAFAPAIDARFPDARSFADALDEALEEDVAESFALTTPGRESAAAYAARRAVRARMDPTRSRRSWVAAGVAAAIALMGIAMTGRARHAARAQPAAATLRAEGAAPVAAAFAVVETEPPNTAPGKPAFAPSPNASVKTRGPGRNFMIDATDSGPAPPLAPAPSAARPGVALGPDAKQSKIL